MKRAKGRILRKRALSMLLALTMLFSSIELTAFATEQDPSAGITIFTEETTTPDDSETTDETDQDENQEETDGTIDSDQPDDSDEPIGEEGSDKADDSDGTQNPDGEDESSDSDGVQDSDDEEETDGSDDTQVPDEADESEETEGGEDSEEESADDLESAERTYATVDNSNMSVSASNALGSLLLDEIQVAAQEEQEEITQSFSISDIEVTGKTAQVRLNAAENCTVAVGIYEDESENPLAYGYAPVEIGTTGVSVDIEIDSMPEYFIIKAYIVDTDSLRPLSKEYTSTRYTKAMQDFLKKTTEDFSQDKVVNLDEDDTTNFLVVKDGNTLIRAEADEHENITNELIAYDEDTNTYTFANVDENITNLDEGDIFVYEYDENDFLIIKVKEIALRQNAGEEEAEGEETAEETEAEEKTDKAEESGEVYDIIAYEDELDVDDVFQYVKIEETIGTADTDEIDPDSCPDGVTYLGRGSTATYAIEGEIPVSIVPDNWKLDLAKAEPKEGNFGPIKGKAEGEVTVSFGIEIGLTYYFDFTIWEVDFSITSELSATGKIEAEGKFSLPLVSAPQIKDEGILTIEYLPTFVIDVSIHGELNTKAAATFSVTLGNQEDNGASVNMEITLLEVSAEVDGYIGVDFNPKVDITGVFHAELDSGVHLGVKASAGAGISGSTSGEQEKHDCGNSCISGEIYFSVPFDGNLKVLKFKEYNLDEILNLEGSLINITFGEFYYSLKHKEFGRGICPHKEYKVTIVAESDAKSDRPNTPIVGAKIAISGQEGITGKNGMLVIWIPSGVYEIVAEYNGSKSRIIEGVEGSKKVLLKLNVVSVSVDPQFVGNQSTSAAIMEDGNLYMWGQNNYGQVGNDSTDNQKIPYRVLDNVKDAGINEYTSYAITTGGSLYMWGQNDHGQTGNGSTDNQLIPEKVLDNVRDAGFNEYANYAITTGGSLYMWGQNDYGQTGNGSTDNQLIPYKVLDNVRDAGNNEYTSYAVTTDGRLYMWGNNNYGQIGNGSTANQKIPIKVLDNVKNARINEYTSYAITTDGSLYMWGLRGDSQKVPVKVLDNVKDAGINGTTRYAITTDGSLYMWGWNLYGQIGNGSTVASQDIPVKVLDNVKDAGTNGRTSYAITANGNLYIWGYNYYGQIGNGSTDNQLIPYKVLDNVKDAGINEYTSYAITTDGSLYMWGWNSYYGQIGNGSTNDQLIPYKVLDNVIDAETNGYASYAITTDKSLYMWGMIYHSSQDNPYSPLLVMKNVREAGMFDVSNDYVITTDGSLYLWGSNSCGQIGNGTTYDVTSPYQVQFPSETRVVSETSVEIDSSSSYFIEPIANSLYTVHDADTTSDNKAIFSNLTPNDIYNIYVMKSKDAEEPLGSDNLLYIAQEVSGADGNLSVDYGMTQDYENPAVFCVGYTQTDLSSAEVTVPDITYDGDAHYPEAAVMYSGQLLAEGTDYEIYGDCSVTDIGEYKIVIKGIGTYCGEKEVTFRVIAGSGGNTPGGDDTPERDDVLPDDIPADGIPEGLWIAGVDEDGYAYTGSAINPEVRVYDHKTLLVEKTDYTIAYKNNIKANDATVPNKAPTITVTGKGNYSGKETQTFKILPLDISVVDISQEDADKSDVFEADDISVVYNGKAQKPAPALYWNGKKLTNKTDYTFTYHEGTYAGADTEQTASVKETGDYYIKLTGKGNFTGTRRLKLTVLPKATEDSSVKPISKATVPKIPNQSYLTLGKNGAVTPEVTVKYGSQTLEPGTHYTVAYSNNTKVGTAYAIITGIEKNGYSGTKRVSFKITGMAISKAKVSGLSGQTFVYNGTDIEPVLTLSVKLNGTDVTLVKDTDYSVKWQKNRNAGTATVTFTGKNGYTGTLKKTFKIKAFNIAENKDSLFKAELKSDTVPYAKGGAKPELTVTFQVNEGTADGTQQTLTLKEGTDYTVSYKNNKAVNDGSNTAKLPTITIKGKGNFTGTYSQNLTYTITAQDLGELKLTAADKVYQNKKNIYTTKVTITDLDGKVLKAGTDYEKKLTYTYKNDTTLDNGTVRQAGEAVDKNDIIPTDTEICVTAASKGSSYIGTLSGEYSFKAYDISGAKVTIPRQTYTGRKITLDKTDEKQILVKVKGKR